MSEKKKESLSNNSHPKIIDSKDQKIIERKPPSDKILYFNLIKNDNSIKSKNEEDTT
ncbi:MAG: hypothetical protein JSV62_13160 [Promethearchaeota archaeon]|nr:MAG: hypothetical protein JSV62_13160 [Candidatus Lokiarchaeota archaeon]